MNRLFTAIMVGATSLLLLFLLGLIASMVVELVMTAPARAPDSAEILFSLKLSLLTATAASILAVLFSVPVAYLLSRHDFPGKSVCDTILDLPIVLSPIALGAMLLIFFNTPVGEVIDRRLGVRANARAGQRIIDRNQGFAGDGITNPDNVTNTYSLSISP